MACQPMRSRRGKSRHSPHRSHRENDDPSIDALEPIKPLGCGNRARLVAPAAVCKWHPSARGAVLIPHRNQLAPWSTINERCTEGGTRIDTPQGVVVEYRNALPPLSLIHI